MWGLGLPGPTSNVQNEEDTHLIRGSSETPRLLGAVIPVHVPLWAIGHSRPLLTEYAVPWRHDKEGRVQYSVRPAIDRRQ